METSRTRPSSSSTTPRKSLSFRLVNTAKKQTGRGSTRTAEAGRCAGRGEVPGGRGRGFGGVTYSKGKGQGQGKGKGKVRARAGSAGAAGAAGGIEDLVQKVDRGSSVNVRGSWVCVEEFDLGQLNKLSTAAPEASDLLWAGELALYDDSYDRVSTRTQKPLQRAENREFYYVSTTDDPAIEKLAEETGRYGLRYGCYLLAVDGGTPLSLSLGTSSCKNWTVFGLRQARHGEF